MNNKELMYPGIYKLVLNQKTIKFTVYMIKYQKISQDFRRKNTPYCRKKGTNKRKNHI